ncbi:MAG: 30S ribosomal protein S15 [Candidatus Thorarchaeota archaeon]
MGRMHTHRKGKSHSMRPTSNRTPQWVNFSIDEVESLIVRLAKEGLAASQIGMKLRDEYAIPLAKLVIGKTIVDVLRENGVATSLPEDLERLLTRAKKLQEHLKIHKNDGRNVRSLELVEAKLHRVSKHYKLIGLLPKEWKYSTVVAQLA